MRRNKYRKIISLMMALALAVSMLPVSLAMAQEDSGEMSTETAEETAAETENSVSAANVILAAANSYDEEGFYTDTSTGTTYYEPATDTNSDGIYEISNAGQLFWFAALVNGDTSHMEEAVAQNMSANAVLTSDIDLESREWTPIGDNQNGNTTEPNIYYSGVFDGGGYTISNLYISDTDNGCQGLFGYIYRGTVDNLFLEDVSIAALDYSGVLVGTIYSGTISNVEILSGDIVVTGNHVGGIAGMARTNSTISACSNNASVTATVQRAGGIAGDIRYSTSVNNCYNTGKITAASLVGGIVGNVNNGYNCSIVNCYQVGELVSGDTVGGIAGYMNGSSGHYITNCYFLDRTADSGIGSGESANEEKPVTMTEEEFASGEVTWLLQNGQSSQDTLVWGQMLTGESVDAFPVLTSDADKKVLKADFYLVSDGSTTLIEDATVYLNNKSVLTVYPSSADTGYLFYTDESCTTIFEESTILTADTNIYARLKVISVTITWGTMKFTYSDSTQVWNPKTHVYDTLEAGWTANETDSGKVTVENEGNVDIAVSYSFTTNTENSAVSELSGTFAADSEGAELIDFASTLSEGDSTAAWLMLSGKPTDYMEEAVIIGAVTVTITEADTE